MSVATTGRAYAARWPRARTAWQLVSAEFLKVRKRRGLVTLAVMLTAGAIVAAGTVLALLHAQDPAKYGPAGGRSNLANAAYMLSMLGAVAAALTGATMGAGDLQAGCSGTWLRPGGPGWPCSRPGSRAAWPCCGRWSRCPG